MVGKVVSAGQKFIQSWEDLSIDMQKHRDPDQLEPKKASRGWFPDVRTIPG